MSADKSNKRKRIVVTIQQKLEALKRIDDGATVSEIAREYGVSPNTVGDWKRHRKLIEDYASQKVFVVERKSMKPASYPKTDRAVHEWFQQQQSRGVHVTGRTIMAKAKELSKTFPEENKFVASEGWLGKWKIRYGISLTAEKLSCEQVSPVTLCTTELKAGMSTRDDLQDTVKTEIVIKEERVESPCKETEEYEEERVSAAAGYQALETALKFVEQQPSAAPEDLNILKKWKDHAARQLT